MITNTKRPENFTEYDGEELMSNFDGMIVKETANAIKGKELYSTYAGMNFHGNVWWHNDKWNCEVWCYGSHRETYVRDTLDEIMEDICNEYGRA